jgi:hypothetical protein
VCKLLSGKSEQGFGCRNILLQLTLQTVVGIWASNARRFGSNLGLHAGIKQLHILSFPAGQLPVIA